VDEVASQPAGHLPKATITKILFFSTRQHPQQAISPNINAKMQTTTD
jgi:hypothetical protein